MATAAETVPSMTTTALVVVATVFPLLSLGSILLRWRARMHSKNEWRADDWWIVGTWIIAFGESITAWVFASINGINHYKVDVLTGSDRSAQCLWVNSLFFIPALAAVKISILLFYKRVFPTQKFRVIAWIAVAVVAVWGLLYVLLTLFQSTPMSSSWTGKGHFNIDIVAYSYTQASTSLALDVIILVFPLPVISRLHLQTRRKIAVMMIFWLGGFCVVASIIRLALIVRVQKEATQSASSGYGVIYIYSKAYIFAIVEPNCSIVAACLPCYGPLVRGRAPESIIRSVRSVLSLSSRKSSSPTSSQQHNEGGPLGKTESAVELTELDRSTPSEDGCRTWERNDSGETSVYVQPAPPPTGSGREWGIEVTTTFETK